MVDHEKYLAYYNGEYESGEQIEHIFSRKRGFFLNWNDGVAGILVDEGLRFVDWHFLREYWKPVSYIERECLHV